MRSIVKTFFLLRYKTRKLRREGNEEGKINWSKLLFAQIIAREGATDGNSRNGRMTSVTEINLIVIGMLSMCENVSNDFHYILFESGRRKLIALREVVDLLIVCTHFLHNNRV